MRDELQLVSDVDGLRSYVGTELPEGSPLTGFVQSC